jgi:hypothetical protein
MAAYDFSNVSSADLLRLEWADEEERKRAANRVNTFAQLMGQRGDWSPTSGSDGVAALTAYSKSRDLEHLQQAQKMMSSALGTPALPYNDPAKFNTWYKTAQIPYRFVKDLRASYKNISDQFRASEKHPGEMTLQEQQIAAGEQAAKMRPYELAMAPLLEEQKEQEIAAGKPATTIVVKAGDELHRLQWDSKTQTYVPLMGADGKAVVSQIDRPTTTEQNVQTYIKMLNDARAEEVPPKGPLSKTEEAEIMRKYGLIDQVVQGGLSKELPTELFNAQIAFATSAQKMQRMLSQLSRPDVAIGGIKGIAKAFSAISGQTKQAVDAMASAAGERHLLTHPYKFGVAQESVALHSNIIDLAYQLARAADPGGRLSDRDVQSQINRITGSLQNKASFAKSLMEVYNQSYERMRIMYQFYNKRGVAGAEEPWEIFLGGLGTMGILTGRLEEFEYTTTGGVVKRGVGYKYYDANGVEQIQPVSEWEVK